MKLFDFLFKNIEFNEKMNSFVENFKNNDWFVNCGNKYNAFSYYEIHQEFHKLKAQERLNQKRNSKNFTSLDNLIIESSRRLHLYLQTYHPEENQVTWNKVAKSINKKFYNKKEIIDFELLSKQLENKCDLVGDLYMYRLFHGTLMELYFSEYLKDIPLFFVNIFDIYKNGHLIIGWEGKFLSQEKHPNIFTPIEKTSGKIIIF